MNKPLKQYLSTPKGQLTAALFLLGAVWLILLILFGADFVSELPGAGTITDARRELKKQERELKSAREEDKEYEDLLKKYRAKIQNSWQEKKHGMAETALRQLVSDTATKLELKPNSLGTVRISRINSEFYYAEIDIMMNGTYEDVLKYIAAIGKITPKLSWRRLNLRPDFRRRTQQQSSITNLAAKNAEAQKALNAVQVNFNGVIRVIGYDGKEIPGVKKP